MKRLSAFGQPPIYISADASHPNDLARAYAEIKKRYSTISGVIHSAVGVFDERLAEMTEQRFEDGLSAKVDISVRIAQIFREEPVDFFLFFSSMESFATSHGKASDTAGCAFMDAYAHQLSREVSSRVKVMNWGYWGDVGAGAALPETVKNRIARSGIGSIEAAEGMSALSTLLAGPFDQLGCVKTTKPASTEIIDSPDSVYVVPRKAPYEVGDLVNMAAQFIAEVPVPRKNADDEERMQSAEDVLSRLLLCQLESTGWFGGNSSGRFFVADLQQKSGEHSRWIQESVSILSTRGYLTYENGDNGLMA